VLESSLGSHYRFTIVSSYAFQDLEVIDMKPTTVRNRLGIGVGVMLAASLVIAACSDDDPAENGAPDGGADTGQFDTAPEQDSSTTPDSGTTDGADADAAPLPGVVTDLAASGDTHTSLALEWTAPPDETGKGTVAGYEIRYSTTPITTEAEFLAATALEELPDPESPGKPQKTIVHELAIATEYHVALRAKYATGGNGPLSNVAKGTTKARAELLISEIAPANTATTGGDFIELVATKAGHAGGLGVSGWGLDLIHTLGPIDVAIGDRIVVHLSGLPGPTGFVQEDESKNKTASKAANASANAFDVYSSLTDLPVVGAVIVVHEPGRWDITAELNKDAVAYFDRSTAAMDYTVGNTVLSVAYMGLFEQWLSPLTPQELFEMATDSESNACDAYVGTVDASGTATACGGTPAGLTDGQSIQRNGTTDTNTSADFTIGAQTRGAPN